MQMRVRARVVGALRLEPQPSRLGDPNLLGCTRVTREHR